MVKTPAEYFADLDLHLSGKDAATAPLSRAEQSFVEKYLGPDALAGIPVITSPESLMQGGAAQAGVQVLPQDTALVPAPLAAAADSRPALVAEEASDVDEAEDQRRLLFSAAEIQLVSVRIAGTSFLLPIMAISEVLRHMPLALLPRAPRHVAGGHQSPRKAYPARPSVHAGQQRRLAALQCGQPGGGLPLRRYPDRPHH